MKIINRTFESKAFDANDPLEHQFEDIIDPSRVRRFIASDDTVDRYGEVIVARGVDFTNYAKNPVIMRFHNTQEMMPVGKAVAGGVRDNTVLLDIEFDPPHIDEAADQLLAKIDHKTVKAGSVGFIPAKDGIAYPTGKQSPEDEELFKTYPGVRAIYKAWELLEYSIVPVPANPNAVLAAYKALHANTQQRFGPGSGNSGIEHETAPPEPQDEFDEVELAMINHKIAAIEGSMK